MGRGGNLLCLWTDGLHRCDECEGERYGDARLIEALSNRRGLPVEEILAGALAEADAMDHDRRRMTRRCSSLRL